MTKIEYDIIIKNNDYQATERFAIDCIKKMYEKKGKTITFKNMNAENQMSCYDWLVTTEKGTKIAIEVKGRKYPLFDTIMCEEYKYNAIKEKIDQNECKYGLYVCLWGDYKMTITNLFTEDHWKEDIKRNQTTIFNRNDKNKKCDAVMYKKNHIYDLIELDFLK